MRNANSSPLPSRQAFTLVEMLVAIALASVMLVIIAQVFSQGSAIVSKSYALVKINQTGRVVLDSLGRDLGAAQLVHVTSGQFRGIIGYNDIAAGSSPLAPLTAGELMDGQDAVAMLTAVNRASASTAWVGYYLDEDGVLRRCQRTDDALLDSPSWTFDKGDGVIVGLNVRSLQLRYRDQLASTPVWIHGWDDKTYLPALVEIRVVVVQDMAQSTGNQEEFVRIVHLSQAPKEK